MYVGGRPDDEELDVRGQQGTKAAQLARALAVARGRVQAENDDVRIEELEHVGDVVRRFESLDSFVGCFPGASGCAVNGLCGLKPALSGALAAFLEHLDSYRLSDLVPDRPAFLERLGGVAANVA